MPTEHDSGYKHLFADPAMMRDLLVGFVPHDWVTDADFATLGRITGSYVSQKLRRRRHTHAVGSVFPASRIQHGKCFAAVYTFVYTRKCK